MKILGRSILVFLLVPGFWGEAWGQNLPLIGVGQGPDPNEGAHVRLYDPSGGLQGDLIPYGSVYGANVSWGDHDGDQVDDVLTGPGPGVTNGPHVRGWSVNGTPSAAVNFFSYGTLNYGVDLVGVELAYQPAEEIVTGAGPGAVFGPHVRGFYRSGNQIRPLGRVNFFAFNTLKWGVQVEEGDFTADGWDEILVAPGISGVFAGHVRAFDTASGSVREVFSSIVGSGPIHVAGADVDADGFAELMVAEAPASGAVGQVRGWNFDNGAWSVLSRVNFIPFSCQVCGTRISGGDLDDDGYDELVATRSGGPAFDTTVRTFNVDGGAMSSLIQFTAFSTGGYGANTAVSDTLF